MRVAYVTIYDARDPDAFNGMGYWAARCMQRQEIDVDYLGPLPHHNRYTVALKYRLYKRVLRQRYTHTRDRRRVRGYGREIADKLRARPADVVLSNTSPGSQPVAYLECAEPIVIWSDATFAEAVRQGKETLTRLCRESRRDALRNEAAALSRATLLLYRSEWAARSAIAHYGVDPDKVHVLPYGPQLDIDHDAADVQSMVEARSEQRWRLLLCGTNWRGKGAAIAVETAALLNQLGLPTQLDIVGARPPEGAVLPSFVRLHGFLRKAVPSELETLRRLYRDAHLFLLPTRAEAYGIVFTEASAFGVPSVATEVGGVPTAVRDGVNGKLFPLAATAEDYATYILDLLGDTTRYRRLAAAAFAEYELRFAWPVIGAELKRLLTSVIER